jgi:hypothetical protein
MATRRFIALVLFTLLAAGPRPADAGQLRSQITGTVHDATGAILPGVTVSLASPELVGGRQTAVTDAQGRYRFFDLPPGTYEVTASLSGFSNAKRPDLRVLAGTTLTVDLPLSLAGTSESVTVSGGSPVVDVTTAAAPLKIDQMALTSLPLLQNKRESVEILNVTPGINARAAFGGARDANLMTVDGAISTIPNNGGTNGIVANPNWMEEIQVVGLGANAEFGDFTGALVNMVTRSGSNLTHGLAEYTRQPSAWQSDNTGSLPASVQGRFRPLDTVSHWDAGVQMGGPVLKDRLFYFAGLQFYKIEELGAGSTGVSPSLDRGPRGVAKLTWATTPHIKLEGTVRASHRLARSAGSLTARPETATQTEEPIYLETGRMTWTVSDRTLLEARASGFDYSQDIVPQPPNTIDGPASHQDTVTGVTSVNAASYRQIVGTRATAGATLTRWTERHQFKAGFDFQRMVYRSLNGYPGGMLFQDKGGQPNQVTIWEGDRTKGVGDESSFFVQDSWEVAPRLRLEPGVRLTMNRGSVPERGSVFSTNPISPRLGFAWDVSSDHRTVVRGHVGIFHDPMVVTLFDYMDTTDASPRITALVVGPNEYQEINRFTPTPASLQIASNLKQSYVLQYLAGVQRQVGHDMSLSVDLIHRRFNDIFAFKDGGSVYAPVQALDPGPDGKTGTADDGGLFTAYALQNPGNSQLVLSNPGAYRRYSAVQMTADKRFSENWQLLAAYTWSRATGNVNNDILEEFAGGTDTGRTGAFADPNLAINKVGRSSLDFPNQLTLRGTYRVPWAGGFTASGIYTYSSGAAWGRRATVKLPQGNVTIQMEPRGTRRIDAKNQLDLRLQKIVPLAARMRASLAFDFFNVNNQGVIDRNRVIDTSGATFGIPQGWSTPRTVQFSARIEF